MTLFKMPSPAPVEVTTEPQAIAQREGLLSSVDGIKEVATADQNDFASRCGSDIQKLLKDVESTRKDLTAPYLAAQRAIKKVADDFSAPLQVALDRLGRLAIGYRKELERQAESDRKARADAIAQAEEQHRKAQEALKAADSFQAQLQADLVSQALEAKKLEAIMAPVPEAAKTEGQSFQGRVLGWECTDAAALWAARPDLCNPPTPKASAIKAVCCPENPPIPGLRLWWESKVTFRSR